MCECHVCKCKWDLDLCSLQYNASLHYLLESLNRMSYTSNLHDALRLKMFEQAEAIMYKPVSDSSLSIIEIGQI